MDTAIRSGPSVNLQFLHYSLNWAAFGIELGYTKFLRKSQSQGSTTLFNIPSAQDVGIQAQDMYISALTRINMFENHSWTPYLLTGLGFHEFDGQADWLPAGAAPGTSRLKQHAFSRRILTVGATGLEGFVMQNLSISFEARFSSMELGQNRFVAGTADSLNYLVGSRYWFGM